MMASPLLDINEGANKRLSVERIYQKKTQLEHILLRPDSYVGSVEEATDLLWVYDDEKKAIVQRQITYVPGLYKIFDEILVNAADNKQRDSKMNTIKIVVDPENNVISVWNNGAGIPVEMHAIEKKYVPELIFGTLLTSSNFNDDQKKVTGGRNGYGAKLCNIFSTEFTVETASSASGKQFKQTWQNNMDIAGKNTVTVSKKDFTKITFKPDLAKFKMSHLNKDIVSLMTRRAYDIAGCTKGVAVFLNGEKIPVKSFKDYVELYLKGDADGDLEEISRKVIHEVVNPRWEVCVTASSNGFKQASFVNSIATTKGGTHVQALVTPLINKLLEASKKKNKGGMELKPFHIKSHLWVFVNCLIENPTFDSQTKENMTLPAKSFGSSCQFGEKFIKSVLGCGIVERVLDWARVKSQSQLNKKQHGTKSAKLKGIAKLDDANDAGGKFSNGCTLIVTEGDSAKTLAVSGLGVVGRDKYGVFPLRGKFLNVREASHEQVMKNEEVKNVIKILGLQYGKKYSSFDELKSLRYGRIMIMADQDQDGSHIKGLVINFFHHNWPQLLRHGFIEEFITPIVKAVKGKDEIAFFSLPEFERWQATEDNVKSWKIKYYKGLGTSTSKEAKEYFSDMDRHRIPFSYEGPQDDHAIELAFSRKCVDERKDWLTNWLQHRRERKAEGLSESFLYGERTESVSYSDFINKELILFSNMDNERSIPSLVDGLKPGQRKVLFTCFKRNDKRDIKVAQLAGSVAEHSAYHHGEQSLMATIINLAQNFVGSNNINVLQPIGQFGTRLHGGKDAASPRYIFTMLSPLARHLFPACDDVLLDHLYDDNQCIEPEWYCPIIPMILVNGAEGIGTGYSTSVPNYNPREIVANIKRMLNGMEPEGMKPWYKNFCGTIAPVEPHKYMVFGQVGLLGSNSFEITELPTKTWTQTYKENVLEGLLYGNDKISPFISDYKEYHTDVTVRFVVTLSPEKMEEAQSTGIHKKFKLVSNISTNNMILFDSNGCLKKYYGEIEILKEFYDVRLALYHKRKQYLEGKLTAESLRLQNQARFITEIIERKLIIERKSKNTVISELESLGYDSDPVKAWKKSLSDQPTVEEEDHESTDSGLDYNYLLSMQFWSLTKEKAEELLHTRDKKVEELEELKGKSATDLWKTDLDNFLICLDEIEERERQEESAGAAIVVKKKGKGRQTKLTGSTTKSSASTAATKPSAFAEVVTPDIPEFCAEKVKKERATKSRKAKAEDPGQTKLPFNSIEEMTTNETETEAIKDEKVKKSAKDSHTTTETSPKDASQTTLKFRAESKKRVYHFSSDSSEDDAVSDHNSDDILIVSPPKKATKTTKTKKQAVDEVATKKTAASKTKQLSVKVTAVKTDKSIKKPVTKGASSKEPSKETEEIGDDLCIIDEEPAKKNTKAKSTKTKAGKRKVSDSESDEVHVVPIVESPVRSKRSGKKIKYYFSDDDDSDLDQ